MGLFSAIALQNYDGFSLINYSRNISEACWGLQMARPIQQRGTWAVAPFRGLVLPNPPPLVVVLQSGFTIEETDKHGLLLRKKFGEYTIAFQGYYHFLTLISLELYSEEDIINLTPVWTVH